MPGPFPRRLGLVEASHTIFEAAPHRESILQHTRFRENNLSSQTGLKS